MAKKNEEFPQLYTVMNSEDRWPGHFAHIGYVEIFSDYQYQLGITYSYLDEIIDNSSLDEIIKKSIQNPMLIQQGKSTDEIFQLIANGIKRPIVFFKYTRYLSNYYKILMCYKY